VQAVVAEHDELVKRRRSRAAKQRIEALYDLFVSRTPSIVALNRWLAPPAKALTDFKLYMLHGALTLAIADRDENVAAGDRARIPPWVPKALGLDSVQVEALLDRTMSGESMSEGRGPSSAAIELLGELGRFGSERTIWRRVSSHRESVGEDTPRPHRPRRPVPTR
jgi:hypothetical protein